MKRRLAMLDKKLSVGLRAALPIFAVTLFLMSTYAAAQQETVLHNFCNDKDGCGPYAGLILAPAISTARRPLAAVWCSS